MTLVFSVNGPNTIWLCADRRLSAPGIKPIDDATKIACVESDHDVALVAYAGLGATALKNQPSDWISNTLRGVRLPLEGLLMFLASQLQQQFPKHLAQVPSRASARHTMLAPAFVDNQARLYMIDLCRGDHQEDFTVTCNRLCRDVSRNNAPPRVTAIGSGREHLSKDQRWVRPLLRLIKAHDEKRIDAKVVADQFAEINLNASNHTQDGSVGSRCTVVWKYRKNGPHKGGGGQCSYTGTSRDQSTKMLPTVGQGLDVRAVVDVITTQWISSLDLNPDGLLPLDTEILNEKLAQLPERPDPELR